MRATVTIIACALLLAAPPALPAPLDLTASSFKITSDTALPAADKARISVDVVESVTGNGADRGDGGDGTALPVRVIVTASDGSHLDGSGRGVYADGRFFADGKFTVDVPGGATKIELAAGPDHVPLVMSLDAKVGRHLRARAALKLWFSPESRRWYSGDNHVHAQHDDHAAVRTDLAYTALQGRANGLSFITEAGSNVSYTDVDKLDTPTFLLRYAPEIRPGSYVGHLNTPGIAHPIPDEQYAQLAKLPLPAEAFIDEVHRLGGAVIHTHPLTPPYQLHWMGAAEVLSDAVLGRCADALDTDSRATEQIYFAVLNLGNRVAVSSYTDSALGRTRTLSPGDRRVYCHADQFDYKSLVDALRRGRTMATNGGPVFAFLSIDGHEPGDVATLTGPAHLTARAQVHSLHPLRSITLIQNGRPVSSFDVNGKQGEVVLTQTVDVGALPGARADWVLLRAEDERGHWSITSPVWFAPSKPAPRPPASAMILEINNATRFAQLRRQFFAHVIVTVSPGDALARVELLKDGQPMKVFTPGDGDHRHNGQTPVTQRGGEFAPGWLWHPDRQHSTHLQADWPIDATGWYALRAVTQSGRVWASDAVRFDADDADSRALSLANVRSGDTALTLWGYGQEMPLADIHLPFEGDHWWYPRNTFWRLVTQFADHRQQIAGGNEAHAQRFRSPAL